MCIITCFPIMYFCGVSAGKNYEKKVLTEMPKINELFNNYTEYTSFVKGKRAELTQQVFKAFHIAFFTHIKELIQDVPGHPAH